MKDKYRRLIFENMSSDQHMKIFSVIGNSILTGDDIVGTNFFAKDSRVEVYVGGANAVYIADQIINGSLFVIGKYPEENEALPNKNPYVRTGRERNIELANIGR